MEPTGWQTQLRGYYSSSLSSTVLALRVITLRAEASKGKQEQLCESLTRTRFCHAFFPAASAGQVTCVGLPLREQPYGSLLYEVFLSENNVQPAVNRQPGYRWGTRRAS